MSYLVLARKHRPVNFEEVIGQEHITELLKKAISSGKIAHAYLLCGPRGIGKTSCARILAKCLNCAKGPTLKPCGECSACKEIAAGNSFDVLEIDGASNRGIDEIRTLRENAKFGPSYGRYKIYIVDEVHMLTTEAFNALLKTLEEPPSHVKFIFATTDVNKLPSTIISRCQRFDFKRISLNTIVEFLNDICKKEKFKIDEDALLAIAKAAQGSLRDALSILDQLSSLSAQAGIKKEDVFSLLGLVETDLLFDMTQAIAEKNCARALEVVEEIIEKGKDIKQLYKDLVEHFRNVMVIKIGGKTLQKLVDYPAAIKDRYLAQSSAISLSDILKTIDAMIEAQDVSRITESMRIPLELALAKVTSPAGMENAAPIIKETVKEAIARKPVPSPVEVLKNQKGEVSFAKENAPSPEPEPQPAEQIAEPVISAGDLTLEKITKGWDALTFAVSRQKMSVATYLQEAVPVDLRKDNLAFALTLGFSSQASFQKEVLEGNDNRRLIEKVFSEKLNATVVLKFKTIQQE
ncbi:MAG: DNA polymerase III, subunit gamma and tau, partial [Omnitrophica WOR_2 bacterium GWA2_47_8]